MNTSSTRYTTFKLIYPLSTCSTRLDQQDIAVLDDVILALGHDLTGRLDSGLVAELTQGVIVVHHSLDEGLLKVGVNHTRRGRRLDALPDGPLADLILTGGEEAGQVQDLAHGGDDLGQTGLGLQLLALLLGGLLIAEQGQALLEAGRDGQQGIPGGVGLDPLKDLGQVLVLLADVIPLTQVDQVHDRLGGEQQKGVDDLDLDSFISQLPHRLDEYQ